jgi:quercetin dioxygenase-like cupin family protein
MHGKIFYEGWMKQPLIWAERCRGRGLVWTPDAKWFINDPLGHMPHSHDDASEIVFLAQGSMEILVGETKRLYRPGDFILMPPGKYHDYWFKGEDPVCLFVLVAPNHKYNRWRTKDFPPEAHQGDAPYANAFEDDALPCDEFLRSEKITLQPGESDPLSNLNLQDRVIYVLNGTAQVKLNTLSGGLAANQYLYICATNQHLISNVGYEPLTYISVIVTDPYTAKGTLPKD